MPRTRLPNNYFRVQGTQETFTFDDKDGDSVELALAQARQRAHYHRGARVPEVLVWRRSSHPAARSIAVIGDPVVSLVN